MATAKILFVGESWTVITTHIKGADQFSQSFYDEGIHWIKNALESGNVEVDHMPCHEAMYHFPATAEQMRQYDGIIFSDVGSNSILLHPDTTQRFLRTPDRIAALEEYVREGGAFLMIGGYMSFSGIEGKAHYKDTLVEKLLPVTMLSGDDRVEKPGGVYPRKVLPEHEILQGIEEEFPFLLFYNRIRAKPGSDVLLQVEEDPLLVVWDYGKGRSAAFAADAAPHGAPPEFLDWKYFARFWQQLIYWLCKGKGGAK